MTISFVLRLVSAITGDIVGEIEAVDTGERVLIRNADELLAYLTRALQGEPA